MHAICVCLLVFCVGLCRSLDLIRHTSWLHEGYSLQSSQPRHVRQSDAPTVCDECSIVTINANLFEVQCITPGLLQNVVDNAVQCSSNVYAISIAYLCAQREDDTYCSLISSSSFSDVEANCDYVEGSTSCSPQCKSSLEAIRNDFGCCINSFFNISSIGRQPAVLSYSLWSLCGVETVSSVCSNIASVAPVNTSVNSTTRCPSAQERTEMELDILCSPAGQVTVDRLYEGDICRKTLANDIIATCGQNDLGRRCTKSTYRPLLDGIASSCTQGNETCSSECRDALLTARNEIGCCVNNLFNMTFGISSIDCQPFPDTIFNLWDQCGVTSPGFCSSSLTHLPPVVTTPVAVVTTTSGCDFLTALTFLSVAMAVIILALEIN